jgi:hypothetical protein
MHKQLTSTEELDMHKRQVTLPADRFMSQRSPFSIDLCDLNPPGPQRVADPAERQPQAAGCAAQVCCINS